VVIADPQQENIEAAAQGCAMLAFAVTTVAVEVASPSAAGGSDGESALACGRSRRG
jgi:hypothetical protein